MKWKTWDKTMFKEYPGFQVSPFFHKKERMPWAGGMFIPLDKAKKLIWVLGTGRDPKRDMQPKSWEEQRKGVGVVVGGIKEQTEATWTRIKESLEEAGASLEDIAWQRYYLVNRNDVGDMFETQRKFFEQYCPDINENPRSGCLLEGMELDFPGMLIAMEVVAVVGDHTRLELTESRRITKMNWKTWDKTMLKEYPGFTLYPFFHKKERMPWAGAVVIPLEKVERIIRVAGTGRDPKRDMQPKSWEEQRKGVGVVVGGIKEQTEATWTRIKESLEESGGSLQDIVWIHYYLVNRDDTWDMWEATRRFFEQHCPDLNENPRAAMVVKEIELDLPDMLIEIEVVAVVGKK